MSTQATADPAPPGKTGDKQAVKAVPWYQRMGPWLGIATGPGVYILGGALAEQLPPFTLALVLPLGTLVLTGIIVSHGILARRRRENLVREVRRVLGRTLGAKLLNLVMALSLIGWFSFYSGIAGFSLANLLGLPGWLGSLLLVTGLFVLSELGLTRWNALVWVTTLAALAAAFVALIVVDPAPQAPASGPFQVTSLLWGVGHIIAYSIVFAVRVGDFTWDLESDRDLIKSGLAFAIPFMIALVIGVILFRRAGESNLAQLLSQSESAFLGHIFLLLAVISPSLSNIYSGSFSIRDLAPLPHRAAALIIVLVGFVLGANRFDLRLIRFLEWMGTVLPAVLAVMLATTMLRQKPTPAVAFIAWAIGVLATFFFELWGMETYLFAGAAVSLISLLALTFLAQRAGPSTEPMQSE